LSKAEDEENAAAMAWMAGTVYGVEGCSEAWYLRENKARKRIARGVCSEVRALRRGGMGFASACTGSLR